MNNEKGQMSLLATLHGTILWDMHVHTRAHKRHYARAPAYTRIANVRSAVALRSCVARCSGRSAGAATENVTNKRSGMRAYIARAAMATALNNSW